MLNKYNYGLEISAMEVGWIMDLDQYLEKMDTTTTFILIQSRMVQQYYTSRLEERMYQTDSHGF